MFFYLGNECSLLNKQSEQLFTDLGWKQQDDVYYKGYCLDYNIDDNIDKIIKGDKPEGIYAVIQNEKIFHSEVRPFPLFHKGNNYTNLKLEGYNEISNNKYILNTTEKTFDVVVKEIIEILIKNLSKVELNIWCTGGIDSTMLIAIAEFAKIPYTIHVAKPRNRFDSIKDIEGTVEDYQSELLNFCRKNYWAYSFLSNFNNKILTTGFYGDEYFCRSIWQIHMLANSFGKLGSEVSGSSNYISKHINKGKYKYLNVLDTNINIDNVKLSTLHTVGTSHVWHFDNTITFCPLMDKRIIQNVWSLDPKTLLECAVDATIQKEIILRTMPDVTMLLDTYKNSMFGRRNFFDNIEKVKLPNCTTIVVH